MKALSGTRLPANVAEENAVAASEKEIEAVKDVVNLLRPPLALHFRVVHPFLL